MPENPYQNPLDTVKEKLSGIAPGERKWAVVCYIPIINVVTCILVAVTKVHSSFCLFHARQGLGLFALWFVTICVALLSPTISLMMWGAVLLLHIAGMVIAYGGKTTKIPILGDLAMKMPETFLFTWLTKKTVDKTVTPVASTDDQQNVNK